MAAQADLIRVCHLFPRKLSMAWPPGRQGPFQMSFRFSSSMCGSEYASSTRTMHVGSEQGSAVLRRPPLSEQRPYLDACSILLSGQHVAQPFRHLVQGLAARFSGALHDDHSLLYISRTGHHTCPMIPGFGQKAATCCNSSTLSLAYLVPSATDMTLAHRLSGRPKCLLSRHASVDAI